MAKNNSNRKSKNRLLGTFELPGGHAMAGQLRIKGAQTLLRVHSCNPIPSVDLGSHIDGRTSKGEYVTLVDVVPNGSTEVFIRDDAPVYHAEFFPHYVAVGSARLQPSDACVMAIHFTTSDIGSLFYDFDAFGLLVNAKPIIDAVLAERERQVMRAVEAGEAPLVAYFAGRRQILEVHTRIGRITVCHCPNYSLGGPEGIYIKNKIVVTVEPPAAVTFEVAINSMHDVCCFFALAAGRPQKIKRVYLSTTTMCNGHPCRIRVHESFEWRPETGNEAAEPIPGDVPLDPIRREEEFRAVFIEWIGRHDSWRIPRERLLECARMGNTYDPNRLIAAANMFDILPPNAVPEPVTLEDDLANAKKMCIDKFRALKQGPDRDSALSALGRLGKPSLPKKVNYRVLIVEKALGAQFPELQLVTNTAIKFRNFFVHGSSLGFDFNEVEPLVPFLTDALEFVFAASDLLDSGWCSVEWASRPKNNGHSFSRFAFIYSDALAKLKQSLQA